MAGVLNHPADRSRRPRPRDFRHRLTSELLGPAGALALRRSLPAPAARTGAGVPVAAGVPHATPAPVGPGALSVTWLGHASALLRVGGITALVDPVLGRGILGAGARLTPPGLTVEALPPVDVLLISHDHYDHLDAPTVRRLPRDVRVLVGVGGGPWFTHRGFTDVTELDWWESVRVGNTGGPGGPGARIEFVPAHHWSRRGAFDVARRLWGGWVLTAPDGRSVYHAGDTGDGPFPGRIGARHRPEIALLPVGAYRPRPLLRGVHLDPEEAVAAMDALRARVMVPIHWGTFVLSGEPVTEPIEHTRAAWARSRRPRADLWDLAVGETRTASPPPPDPRAGAARPT